MLHLNPFITYYRESKKIIFKEKKKWTLFRVDECVHNERQLSLQWPKEKMVWANWYACITPITAASYTHAEGGKRTPINVFIEENAASSIPFSSWAESDFPR